MRRRLTAWAVLAAALAGCAPTATSAVPAAPATTTPGTTTPGTTTPGTGAGRPLPLVASVAGLSPLAWGDPVVDGPVVSVRASWGGCRGAPVAATATAAGAAVDLRVWDRRSDAQVCAAFVVTGRVVVRLPAALAGRPVLEATG